MRVCFGFRIAGYVADVRQRIRWGWAARQHGRAFAAASKVATTYGRGDFPLAFFCFGGDCGFGRWVGRGLDWGNAKKRGNPKRQVAVVTKNNYNETMANITIRNIPESVFIKLKMLADIERRSLNNELLIAIEEGVRALEGKVARREVHVPPDVRVAQLRELAGKWKDKRSTAAIIKDIVSSRSMGKDIKL